MYLQYVNAGSSLAPQGSPEYAQDSLGNWIYRN